jgi:hypothetical protein
MMQRILNSKNLVALVLAAATGMTLYFRVPFPEGNTFLLIMALRSPSAFEVLKYSYTLFLFSTPYIGYSVVLSGFYIFALKAKQRIRAGRLPLFPDPRKRDDLFLVVAEVHNPRKQVPAENPQWLVIPERGLFTGVAILGAIGSGKTSCCMYLFAEQILAYRSGDYVQARTESTQTYHLRDFKLQIDSQDAPRNQREQAARRPLTQTKSLANPSTIGRTQSVLGARRRPRRSHSPHCRLSRRRKAPKLCPLHRRRSTSRSQLDADRCSISARSLRSFRSGPRVRPRADALERTSVLSNNAR